MGRREHGIEVDEKGFVWVGGNADNDNAILKFTLDGKFVMQIGKIAPSKGSNDTTQLGSGRDRDQKGGQRNLCRQTVKGNRRVIVLKDGRRPTATLGSMAIRRTTTSNSRPMTPRRLPRSNSPIPCIA